MTLQVLTANRLDSGEVVFWSGSNWVAPFVEARRLGGPAAEAALDEAKAEANLLLDPYLIDLIEDGSAPVSYRERLRALGPSDRTDLGKQTEGGDAVEAIRAAHGAARSTGRLSLIRKK